eukprot:3391646-Pyramimonas_sp.AAC.1
MANSGTTLRTGVGTDGAPLLLKFIAHELAKPMVETAQWNCLRIGRALLDTINDGAAMRAGKTAAAGEVFLPRLCFRAAQLHLALRPASRAAEWSGRC